MIETKPIISDKLYLSELSERVAKIEGDCAKTDKAWVIVRQATEGDNLRRADRRADSVVEWQRDGVAREKRRDNIRDTWAYEVYLTLCDAGNINANGKPLFTFEDAGDYTKIKGGFQNFLTAYGQLPSVVTASILRAVYKINPDWSLFTFDEDENEDEKNEVEGETTEE